MNPSRWSQVKELFEAALELSPDRRDAFVNEQTADPEVLAELRSLLGVYEGAPEFLESRQAFLAAMESPALEGQRIGAWRLLREIGRGGMGVVWEAVRDDQEYQQRAAIKLLPAGPLTPAEVARFREERQILASLNHPGIARLLDGGTAGNGLPYLVMEYIAGERLDVWLDRHAPNLRERLELFLSICAPVDYAHRRLVVHRDLKPANILVTAEGSARLLDFGIARLLDARGHAHRRANGTARHLTPEYASPEQIRGEAVGTASDIYSLGVVLYRLLTGRAPYDADPEDTLEMMQVICEEEPPPPSAVAASGGKELRGELDAIVLQSLRKNPEQRYASVRALADDVAAWLEGRPVTAHRPSWWLRSARFVRRHKVQSAALGAVLASILAGSVVSLWYARDADRQRRIAEARSQQGRQLAHAVVFDLYEAIARLPGSTPARHILVDRALRYLAELEASGPATRDLQIELAAAYARIGDVLGNPTQAHLGDTRSAVRSETQARRLVLAVLRARPNDAQAEVILADADERLAGLEELQGQQQGLDDLWREATEARRREAARAPGDAEIAARVRDLEAGNLRRQHRWAEAIEGYRAAIALYRQALAENPAKLDPGDRLSTTYHEISRCWKELNRLDEALASYYQAQRLDETRLAAIPGDTDAQADLSFDLVESGWIEYRLGRFSRAISDYERALAIQEQLAAADPQDIRMRLEAAKLMNTAAPAYAAAGSRDKAIRMLRSAAERLESALASDPDNQDTRLHVGWVWCNLGVLYEDAAAAARGSRVRADWADAERCHARALAVLRELKGSGRPDLDIDPRATVARSEFGLAAARSHLGADRQP